MTFPANDTIAEHQNQGISVIVPTLNEVGNVAELTQRIAAALQGFPYEIVYIDDHSDDGTFAVLTHLATQYPLTVRRKQGARGKAFSITEGAALARYDVIAMIDADLQYPPEALRAMAWTILQDEADVVIADRKESKVSVFRKLTTFVFRRMFCWALWKLECDVQSGMKVFRREVYERLDLHPKYAWAFDLEFLLGARLAGYRLLSHDISFAKRVSGETKVRWVSASRQVGTAAIRLRMRQTPLIPFHKRTQQAEGFGFHFKGSRYVTHTTLSRQDLAVERTIFKQRLVMAAIAIGSVVALLLNWWLTLLVLVSVVTTLYFLDLLFGLYLILRSFYREREYKISEQQIATREQWFDWPAYTIFCPLYRESEVVPQFVEAMSAMDYPKDKLEVQLLLEEDDTETIDNIRRMDLPAYFKILVVPHAMPKTKPKACNYGLAMATGKYAVIYDAEDIPDRLQLKKAVVAFEKAGPKIGCIQAKLNYYNWNQNLLTRLFTLEYSLWFNLILPGLHSTSAPIPLGGTSNHFRVADLRWLEGWDPFNVTEDADLGMRIAKRGLRTAVLDSFTMEEANSSYLNWFKQRSRWIKGYMQTYLVHMRRPGAFLQSDKRHLPFFQLIIGGKIASMLINPILWILTVLYFTAPQATVNFISSLYLEPFLYIGVISLVFGNFLYMYYYMVGAAKQQKPELIVCALLVPLYWMMMSWAAILALRDLIIRPFHWHKTKHGLHLRLKTPPIEGPLAPGAVS